LTVTSDRIKIEIKARAKSLGFCLCGVSTLEEMRNYPVFEKWLAVKQNGCMRYLDSDRHRLLRKQPKDLAPWAKTIVVLAWPYNLNYTRDGEASGQIAGYAGFEDYHSLLPQILKPLLEDLPNICGEPVQSQVYCDSAPILERELGVRAGLGWIGKNSCLINPSEGSSFLLAEVFLDIPLTPDKPYAEDRCGTCRRCIEACPVACINSDRTIDANRCVSALTIEQKESFTEDQLSMIGNRVFGCDICQSVCPWNHKKQVNLTRNVNSWALQEMNKLLTISETSFREKFKGSSIMRSKRRGLIRNLCAVIGNLRISICHDNLVRLLETDPDPVIQISAGQALMKINPEDG
jgi:epoxyqueuosine reductase